METPGRPDRHSDILACVAGQPTKNEAVELGVIAGDFKPQWSGCPPQSDLDRFGGFDAEIGIADIEGDGRIVRAARKQLGRIGCALDVLAGNTRNRPQGRSWTGLGSRSSA